MIRVVGLGPGDPGLIPERNIEALQSASRVVLRTSNHPTVEYLVGKGISFESCDDLYDSLDNFDDLYEAIAARVMSREDTVYAVPGHPMVGEESVRILANKAEIEVFAAPSFIDATLAAIAKPFSGALQVWNAHEPEAHWQDARSAQLIYQLDSQDAASSAKLRLLKFFPPEHECLLVRAAGTPQCRVATASLEDLDRQSYDPLTSAYCDGMPLERPLGFYGLVNIVDRLLGPGGCPWDREQTHESLKKHAVEETYEVLEAIDSNDLDKLCEELGDFLLQALMHAQMDAIEGLYDIDDVIQTISDKLVRRHPHVFGDVEASDADEVLKNWDAIKQMEKGSEPQSILAGVPKSLPSLLRAHETSKRAVRVGFEWGSLEDVLKKLEEEKTELREAIASRENERIESEIGDLLFTIVNIARWLKIEPEEALRKMVNRFTSRFQQMEQWADKPLRELTFAEWDSLWERAKAAQLPS